MVWVWMFLGLLHKKVLSPVRSSLYKTFMLFEFPNIDPVALSLGPLQIRWYALAYLAGFLLGWRYCLNLARLNGTKRPNVEDIDDFLPWAICGVILGGRLGYVLFYQFEYYSYNPLDVLKIWQGGMSFHGGALGVAFVLILYPLLKKISCLRLADIVSASVPIGLFFGRIANFINGELFGRVTQSPLGMVFPGGGPEPRHPSQLYEAALEGALLFTILFIFMRFRAVRERPGAITGVFLVGYGTLRAFVEQFREPDSYLGFVFDHFSMGQLLSAPMVLGGALLILFAVLRKKPEESL